MKRVVLKCKPSENGTNGKPTKEKTKKKARKKQLEEEIPFEKKLGRKSGPYMIPVGSRAAITDALQNQMVSHIEDLLPVEDACALIGLLQSTHYRWMKNGKVYIESCDTDTTESPIKEHLRYAAYFMAINKALAKFRQKLINRSFVPDKLEAGWIRDMTILERRDRQVWGRITDAMLDRKDDYDPDEAFL